MGQKVHPVGFRIGVIKGWQAKWYADKHYTQLLHEDLAIRRAVQSKYSEAGVSLVEIERGANEVSVTVHTARPGIVIGRGGQRVDEMKALLEKLTGKRVRLNIQEIRQPELDAYLVAKNVAEQLERRVSFRRVIKQAVSRTMQRGAKGIKIRCSGRLGGAELARQATEHQGRVPLHTLRADIDYGLAEARTAMGRIGVKVWICKGEILPEPKRVAEAAEAAPPMLASEEEGVPAEELAAPEEALLTEHATTEASEEERVPAEELAAPEEALLTEHATTEASEEERVPAEELAAPEEALLTEHATTEASEEEGVPAEELAAPEEAPSIEHATTEASETSQSS